MAKRVRRVELRLNIDDPTTQALINEAIRRNVSLAEHVEDLLKARHLGPSWGAFEPPAAPEPTNSAAAIAEAWM